jgi:hypothetical protein
VSNGLTVPAPDEYGELVAIITIITTTTTTIFGLL